MAGALDRSGKPFVVRLGPAFRIARHLPTARTHAEALIRTKQVRDCSTPLLLSGEPIALMGTWVR